MTIRGANYKRRKNDSYPTPVETTEVVLRYFDNRTDSLCDPCCGEQKKMIKAFNMYGFSSCGDDIVNGFDFLKSKFPWKEVHIITNPPYGGRTAKLAIEFIARALKITETWNGKVAMLLPADFDSGKSRSHVFGQCRQFSKKIVLLNRVRWFNGVSGSTNHAWYIWDHKNRKTPIILYAAQEYIN